MKDKVKNVCWIRIAKNISYFFIPILTIWLALILVSVIYVNETGLTYNDIYYMDFNVYNFIQTQVSIAVYAIPIILLLIIAMASIIIIGIGKTRNYEGIYLNWFDKVPIGVIMICAGVIMFLIIDIFYVIPYGIVTDLSMLILGSIRSNYTIFDSNCYTRDYYKKIKNTYFYENNNIIFIL